MFYLLAIGFGMRAVALVLMLVLVGGGESALGPLKPAAVAAAAAVASVTAPIASCAAPAVDCLARALCWLPRALSSGGLKGPR